jgi:hypothetical protein
MNLSRRGSSAWSVEAIVLTLELAASGTVKFKPYLSFFSVHEQV